MSNQVDVSDLIDQHYNTVNFAPPRGFDPQPWASWLATDYNYVDAAGIVSAGREIAVRRVLEDFSQYSVIESAHTTLTQKVYNGSSIATVLAMAIAALSKDGRALGFRSTVFLNLRKSDTRWLVEDEIVVPRDGNFHSRMKAVPAISSFLREFRSSVA
jgi:hypothetical protein